MRSDENDPPGRVGLSLRAVKTFPRRNPPPKLLPVRLLLQGSVTTGNQSSGPACPAKARQSALEFYDGLICLMLSVWLFSSNSKDS